MAQFHFNLEGVLAHRQRLEDGCLRALAVVRARMQQAENELRELNNAIKASTEDVRQNRLVGRVDLGYLAAHRRYVAAMTRKGTMMVQQMALIQRDVESAQRALAEAAKGRKIIEKLKEKQFDRWRTDQARREAAALDDVVMRMAAEQMAIDQLQSEAGVVP